MVNENFAKQYKNRHFAEPLSTILWFEWFSCFVYYSITITRMVSYRMLCLIVVLFIFVKAFFSWIFAIGNIHRSSHRDLGKGEPCNSFKHI